MNYPVHISKASRRVELKEKLGRLQFIEERKLYEGSLFEFVKASWSSIDSSEFKSNWAIEAFCLPYAASVVTRNGPMAIGDIVKSGWVGEVLSYDHSTLRHSWKPIVRRMKSPAHGLVSIKTTDGRRLEATDNHPVFVVGRGYVPAGEIRAGDELLQALRGTFLSTPFEATRWVLRHEVLRRSEAFAGPRDLSEMRWGKILGRCCLPEVFCRVAAHWRDAALRALRYAGLPLPSAVGPDFENLRGVLQQEMRRTAHERDEQQDVHSAISREKVSACVYESAEKDHLSGRRSLLSVLSFGHFGRAPHRSRSSEQSRFQSGRVMSAVPRDTAPSLHDEGGSYRISTATVSSVERAVSLPAAVYNLEVLDNHNFFADGILVHNCDHLECVTMGLVPRLLANYPPRASKTTIASICWPAWTWARSQISFRSGPQVRFLCGSYNAPLALSNSNKCRRLIQSPFYQKYWGDRFELTDDQNTKTQFDNTKGGTRISTSVGGSLLGLGGDVICIDDPHNTETEKVIETDADRNKVEGWFKEVESTRLNDPKQTAIVVIMQRLHERDLSGVILDSDDEDWTHLMIPMEFDENRRNRTIVLPQYEYDGEPEPWTDPRTKDGELMWPERFGRREVERMKTKLGPYMAAGRLQQSPVPKGGGILMRDWWQLWDQREAKRYGLEWSTNLKEFPPFELVVGSVDTSFGLKEENDFNAMTVWGVWIDRNRNRRAMMMFAWAKRLKLNGKVIAQMPTESKVDYMARQKEEWGLIEWVADTSKRYKVQRLLIEDKTRGRDVAQEINRLHAREKWGVELVEPVGDKVSRTHGIVPLFTDNGVWAPNTRWAEAVIKQCATFPKDAHDDMHDTVTQFLKWARENGILVRADEMSAALEDEMRPKHADRGVAEMYGV